MMIDLHVHSTFSDGSLTPTQVAERGRDLGLKVVALTDHDTTGGLAEFLAAARACGIEGIPGVEISVDTKKGTLHMLGYFLDSGNAELQTALTRIREGRKIRNQGILESLNRLGFALTMDEVAAYAGEDVVGRPHFAMAMGAKGYVSSKEEAFEKYLGKGKTAYVDRYRMSSTDSVRVIRGAGGVPVLAHPFTLDLGKKALDELVDQLKAEGLQGIEVYYSEHSPEMVGEYEALAKKHGLALTGGSDFHGALNPMIELGRGFGGLNVADELVEELRRRKGPTQ